MGVKYSNSIGQNVFNGLVIEEKGTVLVVIGRMSELLFKLGSVTPVDWSIPIFLNKLNRLLISDSVADEGT